MGESDSPVWVELRNADGTVIEHAGLRVERSFSAEEEHSHALNRQPLYKVMNTAAGEVIVEDFPIHLHRNPPPAMTPGTPPPHAGPPAPQFLEIAMRLGDADRSAFWPIRRNLIINCAGAMALLLTALIAGLGFRSYARGKRLEAQLEIARQVQSELLPSVAEGYAGVQLATQYTPAEQVGGDFYDVFRLKDDGLALVMGDVSGKGVPAALLMGVIHGAVRSSSWSESRLQHESGSEHLNRLLCERTSGERYASMVWCYYDSMAQTLHYVNAGHCRPLVARRRDPGIEIIRLDTGGAVLGILPDARYQQNQLQVCSQDILVLYSDGLIEIENTSGEEYGEERLGQLLTTMMEKSPEDIRRGILSSLTGFSSGAPLRDDLTFVIARFDGLPKR
jgi:sigma-B regulation protein RsbU (phosphoserine phosphatase)